RRRARSGSAAASTRRTGRSATVAIAGSERVGFADLHRVRPVAFLAATMAGAILVLAGCSGTPAPICPRVAVLDQASTLTRYRPGGSGPDVLMFRADIERIDTDCKYSGTGGSELESNVRLHVSATRGPAMQGDAA